LRFMDELYDFGDTLGCLPYKYSICRNKLLAKKSFHCVTYKKYVFIHKVVKNQMVISNIIHGSRLA